MISVQCKRLCARSACRNCNTGLINDVRKVVNSLQIALLDSVLLIVLVGVDF